MKKSSLSLAIVCFSILLLSFTGGRKVPTPPGTIKLKENFYIDQTEIRNLDYLEYTHWISRIHGRKSNTYAKALPDTTVWEHFNKRLTTEYFRDPIYLYYPVVGLTKQQATNYCNWRSERVYEMMLIGKGIIKFNTSNNIDSVFAIEKMLSGAYPTKRKFSNKELFPIPHYRLPSKDEWEFAATGGLDPKKFEYGCKNNSNLGFATVENQNEFFDRGYTTRDVKKTGQNNYKIWGMIGNVAEMVQEDSLCKGGGFFHTAYECKIQNNQTSSAPKAWIGFRCVCTWINE